MDNVGMAYNKEKLACFIYEEGGVNYIDSNGFLSDSWKTEYSEPMEGMESINENWREENDYWKKLR